MLIHVPNATDGAGSAPKPEIRGQNFNPSIPCHGANLLIHPHGLLEHALAGSSNGEMQLVIASRYSEARAAIWTTRMNSHPLGNH